LKINSSKNLKRHYKPDKWEFSSLTIKKEMVFSSVAKLEKVVSNLNRLKWERFHNVVVPNYEYEINDHILVVEMDYVRGTYPRSIHHYNIIYDEFVERESDFSCTDYNPANFIVKDDRVYLIDLDSYGYIDHKARLQDWEMHYGIFSPIIRNYKGKMQMEVDLSCNNLEYLKLKKLLENLFNAKVSRSASPYFAHIDGTEFNSLEDTIKYLRELYEEILSAIDLTHMKHSQRKNVIRTLSLR
tara:strand:- start:397 stop:1122 length:726 start_codon:yes stop_codon:yes gene_type:complete